MNMQYGLQENSSTLARCGIPVLCKSMLNAESLVTENKVGSLYSDPNEIISKVLELGVNKKDL